MVAMKNGVLIGCIVITLVMAEQWGAAGSQSDTSEMIESGSGSGETPPESESTERGRGRGRRGIVQMLTVDSDAVAVDLKTGHVTGDLTDFGVDVLSLFHPQSEATTQCSYAGLLQVSFDNVDTLSCMLRIDVDMERNDFRQNMMYNFGEYGYKLPTGSGDDDSVTWEIDGYHDKLVTHFINDTRYFEIDGQYYDVSTKKITVWLARNTAKIQVGDFGKLVKLYKYDYVRGAEGLKYERAEDSAYHVYVAFNRKINSPDTTISYGVCLAKLSWDCL